MIGSGHNFAHAMTAHVDNHWNNVQPVNPVHLKNDLQLVCRFDTVSEIFQSIDTPICTEYNRLHQRPAIKVVLTLNMLNCFKDYQRYIHVSYHILDFMKQKKTKFTIQQPYMLPILYYQYHACWWRHCIVQISRNILSLPSEELKLVSHKVWNKHTCTSVIWKDHTIEMSEFAHFS